MYLLTYVDFLILIYTATGEWTRDGPMVIRHFILNDISSFDISPICSHVTFHANRIVFQIQNEFMYTFCYTWKLFSMLCSLNLPDFFIHSFIYIYGKMKCHRVKCRKEEMSPWKKCLISYNHDVSFYQWHQKNIFSDHFWLFFSILKKNPANCQVANLS